MLRDAARAGTDPLNATATSTETVRILATEFTITSNKPELIERLPYVAQRADQDVPLREHCAIEVMWTDEEYRISGGGYEDEFELSLPVAFNTLFARLHDRAIGNLPDHTRIHAASGLGERGMFLLVGEKWAGKTTLAMHLLLEGFDILGDELVLLRDRTAITFPRRFYLRHTALELLPGLADATRGAPFVNAEIEGRLLAIDPLTLGRPWRIRPAPISAVIFIEPNHGGASSLVASSKVDMVRRVLAQCTPPGSGRKDWLADLCATINSAETMVLNLGDLASATEALREIVA